MANYTENLHLKLPLGSKYWNYDTWNENMKKLDEVYPDIQQQVFDSFTADRITVANQRLDATNMQDAIDEIMARESSLHFITVSGNTVLRPRAEGHTYFVLTFGDTVPSVSFLKYPTDSPRALTWINGEPIFEANSIYDISILKMCGVWYKRGTFDYSNFFEYYIENDVLYITKIKASDWYAYFGNYDVIIPSTLLGYPVMLDGDYYE